VVNDLVAEPRVPAPLVGQPAVVPLPGQFTSTPADLPLLDAEFADRAKPVGPARHEELRDIRATAIEETSGKLDDGDRAAALGGPIRGILDGRRPSELSAETGQRNRPWRYLVDGVLADTQFDALGDVRWQGPEYRHGRAMRKS